MGGNRPVNGEDMSSSPDPGRPHVPWDKYTSSAITTESWSVPEPMHATAEQSLLTANRESRRAARKTQRSQK